MIKIFIESKKDSTPEYKFLKSILNLCEIDSELYRIEPLNGKDTLHLAKNQFLQNSIEGGRNLIIFDADSADNKGGFKIRRQELLCKLKDLNIEADVFLWPDNSSDGDFEMLLESIARKDLHARFFGCFSDFENCLGKEYISPNRKGKLHTYISSMKLNNRQRRNLGSGEWLYENEEYWNLKSEKLEPLKKFICGYF